MKINNRKNSHFREKLYCVFAILFTFAYPFYGGDIRTITISNAVELALNNNLDLKQSEKDVKIAEAQYGESFADFWLPGINLSGGYTILDPLTVSNGIISTPSSYSVIGGKVIPAGFNTISNVYPDNYSAGVSISKPLFSGFRNWNSLQIKELNLTLARKKYEDEKQNIIYTAKTSFYNLLVLRENIKLDQDLDRQLSNQLISSRINYANGLVSEYDNIRVEVLYKNNLPNLIQASNAYQTAYIALCDLIGVKDYDGVDFLGNMMDYTNIVFTNTNAAYITGLVMSNSIDLLSLEDFLITLDLTRKVNEANLYPAVSASFGYQYNYKREFTDTDRSWWPSWTAGIQLNMAVDSWIPVSRTQQTSREYQESITKTELAKQELINSLGLQVKTLLLQLDQAKQNIASQQEALRLAKIGLDMANVQYGAGQASSLDLTDAEASYTQAMGNYLLAIYSYFSSALRLKRLMGEIS